MIGGGPILPEILSQTDPVGAKTPILNPVGAKTLILNRYSPVAPHP